MRAEVMAVEAMVAVSINHCINQRTLRSFPTNQFGILTLAQVMMMLCIVTLMMKVTHAVKKLM